MSTNPKAYIYVTQLNMASDWLVRITYTFHIIKDGSTYKKREGYRSLFYLLAACQWLSSIVIYLFGALRMA